MAGPAVLPAQLRAFLHSCIESIEQIEVLMLLRGSSRPRTATDVATALGVPPIAMRHSLEALAARRVLQSRGSGDDRTYVYAPASDDLAQRCDLLADYYVTSRQAVLGYVATGSRLSAKHLADAFRLRKPEKPEKP